MTPEETAIVERITKHGYPHIAVKLLPDGNFAWVCKYIFTCAILVSDPTIFDEQAYVRRYCYTSPVKACIALDEWNPEQNKEPTGWVRNPETGRRRPNGDDAQEYIAF